MLLITIAALITLTAALAIPRMRRLRRAETADLGWMSEQWLAENRASTSKD